MYHEGWYRFKWLPGQPPDREHGEYLGTERPEGSYTHDGKPWGRYDPHHAIEHVSQAQYQGQAIWVFSSSGPCSRPEGHDMKPVADAYGGWTGFMHCRLCWLAGADDPDGCRPGPGALIGGNWPGSEAGGGRSYDTKGRVISGHDYATT